MATWRNWILGAMVLAMASGALAQEDYLSPELRARVEALKAAVAAEPTGPATREARMHVLWDWMNAYSLTGRTLPVNAVFLGMSVLTYPESADGTGATLDAFVKEFTLLDEQPDAIGTLTADLGPYVAGAFVTVRQTHTVGTKPVETGGGFLVTRHFMADTAAGRRRTPPGITTSRFRRRTRTCDSSRTAIPSAACTADSAAPWRRCSSAWTPAR
ncbi:MAG: hypothetical protein F4X99_19935 [Gammaproteobacteria bacterium]|nr:hypothetical protein [Gammaproteobacteria bacterium]